MSLNKHRRNMGAREEYVMDNFQEIRLVGTHGGERNDYQYPLYRVYSKPDNDGRRRYFDYKVEGGELYIY